MTEMEVFRSEERHIQEVIIRLPQNTVKRSQTDGRPEMRYSTITVVGDGTGILMDGKAEKIQKYLKHQSVRRLQRI